MDTFITLFIVHVVWVLGAVFLIPYLVGVWLIEKDGWDVRLALIPVIFLAYMATIIRSLVLTQIYSMLTG